MKGSDRKEDLESSKIQRKSRYYDTWQRMKEMGGDEQVSESGISEKDLENSFGKTSRSNSSGSFTEVFNSPVTTKSMSSNSIAPLKKKLNDLNLDDSIDESQIRLFEIFKKQKSFEDCNVPLLSVDNQFRLEMSGDGDFSDLQLIQINEFYKDDFYNKGKFFFFF